MTIKFVNHNEDGIEITPFTEDNTIVIQGITGVDFVEIPKQEWDIVVEFINKYFSANG